MFFDTTSISFLNLSKVALESPTSRLDQLRINQYLQYSFFVQKEKGREEKFIHVLFLKCRSSGRYEHTSKQCSPNDMGSTNLPAFLVL